MISHIYRNGNFYHNPTWAKKSLKKKLNKGKKKKPVHLDTYGYVYYVYNKDSNAIKVGFTSNDPTIRLKALQTSSPCQLTLLAYRKGKMRLEQNYHEQLKDYRLNGEWFSVTTESLALMREQLTKCSIKDKNVFVPLISSQLKLL